MDSTAAPSLPTPAPAHAEAVAPPAHDEAGGLLSLVHLNRLELRRRFTAVLARAMRGNARALDELPPARSARVAHALADQQRRLDALLARPSGLRRAPSIWRAAPSSSSSSPSSLSSRS